MSFRLSFRDKKREGESEKKNANLFPAFLHAYYYCCPKKWQWHKVGRLWGGTRLLSGGGKTKNGAQQQKIGERNELVVDWGGDRTTLFPPYRLPLGSLRSPIFFRHRRLFFVFPSPTVERGPRLVLEREEVYCYSSVSHFYVDVLRASSRVKILKNCGRPLT